MRTLSEMIEKVKVHVRAAENLTWSATDYEDALEEAARLMWRQLAETPGKRCLRAFYEVILPDDDLISIPDDCIHIERVQFINQYGITMDLPYVMPYSVDLESLQWASTSSSQTAGWSDDQLERIIRVFGVPDGRTVRLVYTQMPVFPFEDSGTFRSPDAGDTATYPALPDLADAACEHFAAALLCAEELSDTVPVGYHGQQYSALMKMMRRGMAVTPSRTYVRHTSGRG